MLGAWAAELRAGTRAASRIPRRQELAEAERAGAPLFAVNVSVGLALPGVARQVARDLLHALPPGTGSVAGARSVAEAREMRAAGADAVLVRREALEDLFMAHHGFDPAEALAARLKEYRDALAEPVVDQQ